MKDTRTIRISNDLLRILTIYTLCVLALGFVTLSGAAQARGATVIKRDLAPAGVSIIVASDPAYDAELQHLGFADNADALAVKAFSAILKNTVSRSVVAFAIKWTFVDSAGNELSRGFSFVQPSGLLDKGKMKRDKADIEHQVRPATSRLITINGMARSTEELHDIAGRPFDGTVKSVALDLAIFDDGEAVGPNELGLMEHFSAFVNAEQDLMQEVSLRLSKGETMREILADIRSRLGADAGSVPTTAAAMYEHNLRIHLRELETTSKNAGEMAARNIVANRKYDVRPNIHKGANHPETEVK